MVIAVIATAQLHSTKPELRLCTSSNPARGVSEICNGEDLWQWSRLEIRLNAFRRSIIPQKQFIIIMFTTISNKELYQTNQRQKIKFTDITKMVSPSQGLTDQLNHAMNDPMSENILTKYCEPYELNRQWKIKQTICFSFILIYLPFAFT